MLGWKMKAICCFTLLGCLAFLRPSEAQGVVISVDPTPEDADGSDRPEFPTFPPVRIPDITFPGSTDELEISSSDPKWLTFPPIRIPGVSEAITVPPVRYPGSMGIVPRSRNKSEMEETPGRFITFPPVRIPGLAEPITFPPIKLAEATGPPIGSREVRQDEAMSYVVSNASVLSFDCRRYGHDCFEEGGLCDMDTGECLCDQGYAGFDCSMALADFRKYPECQNGEGCGDHPNNTCLWSKDLNDTMCKCDYGIQGDWCQDPPITLKCSESKMAIEVRPFPSFLQFEGLIFIINSTDDVMVSSPECRFQQAEGMYRFEATYKNLISRCAGYSEAEDVYATKFVLQADPHWLTPFDQIFNIKCISKLETTFESSVIVSVSGSANTRPKPGEEPVGVSNSLVNIPVNRLVAEHKRIDSAVMPRVELTVSRIIVYTTNNITVAPISEPLRIGDPVQIKIFNVNSSLYSHMRAEDCLLKMDNSVEMKVIRNMCPASKFAWSLLRWDHTEVTNSSISFWLILPANALAGQSRFVDIYCRVKVCTQEAAEDCAISPDGCSNSTAARRLGMYPPNRQVANYGRRKREVIDNSLDEAQMFEDFFSSHPFIYTTVHQRFRVRYEEANTKLNDAARRFVASRSAPSTKTVQNVISALGFVLSLISFL